MQVVLPGLATDVVFGSEHTCALLGSGAVSCWGRGEGGELGDGKRTDSTVPVAVSLQ